MIFLILIFTNFLSGPVWHLAYFSEIDLDSYQGVLPSMPHSVFVKSPGGVTLPSTSCLLRPAVPSAVLLLPLICYHLGAGKESMPSGSVHIPCTCTIDMRQITPTMWTGYLILYLIGLLLWLGNLFNALFSELPIKCVFGLLLYFSSPIDLRVKTTNCNPWFKPVVNTELVGRGY